MALGVYKSPAGWDSYGSASHLPALCRRLTPFLPGSGPFCCGFIQTLPQCSLRDLPPQGSMARAQLGSRRLCPPSSQGQTNLPGCHGHNPYFQRVTQDPSAWMAVCVLGCPPSGHTACEGTLAPSPPRLRLWHCIKSLPPAHDLTPSVSLLFPQ